MNKKKTAVKLTENSLTVLRERYLARNQKGEIDETPDELFWRVAKAVSEVESKKSTQRTKLFYELMASCRFMPNTPTLIHAGRPLPKKEAGSNGGGAGQLSACYVLPVGDSLDGIFDAVKYAAKIHQSGGGTGFSFSSLRAKGSPVGLTRGIASGPVSFMRIFDVATDTIKQGGARRGANMAVLRVDHPDILEFARCKLDLRSVTNFNISVGITEEFMKALHEEGDFHLRDPRTGKSVSKVKAKALFSEFVQSAWACGDPGLVFLDRMEMFNPTPSIGKFESTNPCGEQPLLPYESCNLGSLNVGKYIRDKNFDWNQFREDIHAAVRFLDNVIDLNRYPLKECEEITLRNRKIGLGVMGFADSLLLMGIPYSSEEGYLFGERLMSFLDREAKSASYLLAKERGSFPNWKKSMWDRLGYPKLRNATVSTVAPTGTISIIAGASSGIEPIFSGVYHRNVLEGKRLLEIHPAVQEFLAENSKKISANIHITDIELSQLIGPAWSPSHRVPVEAHVKMQSVFQRHSDSAVSKTVNLPAQAKVEDVANAYLLAYRLGCKGITVYRDQCRPTQVLESSRPGSPQIEVCSSC